MEKELKTIAKELGLIRRALERLGASASTASKELRSISKSLETEESAKLEE